MLMAIFEYFDKNAPFLEMTDVSFSAGNVDVIKNVSIQIAKGTTTAFLGKSGCGKTTALKILAALINPTEGKVRFRGCTISDMSANRLELFRKRSGFVFQDSALFANQDIYHNLELPLMVHCPKLTPKERRERIHEVTKSVGYEKPLTYRPAQLSTGEQKKIGFARAIIYNPEILFVDECTESVDDRSVQKIVTILQNFCYNKKNLIYVSHDNDFIKTFGGDKYVFNNGVVEKVILQEHKKEDEIQN